MIGTGSRVFFCSEEQEGPFVRVRADHARGAAQTIARTVLERNSSQFDDLNPGDERVRRVEVWVLPTIASEESEEFVIEFKARCVLEIEPLNPSR